MKGLRRKKKTKKNRSDFVVILDEIPNGNRKPVETCEEIEKFRKWRERSKNSQVWFY